MVFSSGTEYALKAIVYMARHPQTRYFGVKELAVSLDLSSSYLAKVLQILSKMNFLQSVTGPGGGFGLSDTTLSLPCRDIVDLLTDHDLMNRCVFGFSECGNDNPCIIHDTWAPYRDRIAAIISNKTIGELAEESWPLFESDRHLPESG